MCRKGRCNPPIQSDWVSHSISPYFITRSLIHLIKPVNSRNRYESTHLFSFFLSLHPLLPLSCRARVPKVLSGSV